MSTETITQIQQPAPFIEAAAKPFLQELTSAVGDFKQQDLSNIFGPQSACFFQGIILFFD